MTGGLSESAQRGREAAWQASGGGTRAAGDSGIAAMPTGDSGAPAWARRLRAEQRRRHRVHTTAEAVKEGDKPGAAANPDLEERD
jgi:type IV secretion system protein TrbL